MKKFIKLLFVFLTCFLLIGIIGVSKTYCYSSDLDEITYYEVKVDPVSDDGSLDITIHIDWKVLDSSTDGPLSWVKIGIPNKYVRNIKPLTDNIQTIDYYSDSGSFIRVDFDKEYYRNEIAEFAFSFNIYRMYHLNEESVYYNYNPGYFDNIIVDDAVLLWNATGVTELVSQGFTLVDGYYKYETPLNYGKAIGISLYYGKDYFKTLDSKLQYSENYMTTKDIIKMVAIATMIALIILAVILITYHSHDPYMSNRGFIGRPTYFYYGYYHHNHHYFSSGYDKKGGRIVNPTSENNGHSSGGGGGSHCACACACACAGGGRAGCSKKDFYKVKLDYLKLEENLKDTKKK